jgi:SNF2 family DNA or RNA helicase
LVAEALRSEGVTFSYLDGQVPLAERQRRVEAFQKGQGGDVFLISLKAGGTGLTLTAADYVIHLDPWWNPAVEDQASDRAHRIGQDRPVTVYRLIAEGTIEQQILSLHKDKRELVDALLSGAETAGKLTAMELAAMIQGGAAKPAD